MNALPFNTDNINRMQKYTIFSLIIILITLSFYVNSQEKDYVMGASTTIIYISLFTTLGFWIFFFTRITIVTIRHYNL